jgi:DNA adenine methylase
MTSAAQSFMRVDHLWQVAERLRGVTIEQMDALEFIALYDQPAALFYVDPPYLIHTRFGRHYEHEAMSRVEHQAIFDALAAVRGMVVLSHYPCQEYDDWYLPAGWRRVDRSARIDGGGSAVESLYLSPNTLSRLRHNDLPLWAASNGGEP